MRLLNPILVILIGATAAGIGPITFCGSVNHEHRATPSLSEFVS